EGIWGGEGRQLLEEALPAFLYTRRWFAGRGLRVAAARIDALIPLKGIHFLIARVEYANADAERFMIPLAAVADGRPVAPPSVLAVVRTGAGDVTLVDAVEDAGSARGLLEAWVTS